MGEILINQIFAGSYLQEGSNIGHEVINLIKDDNGDNFLYITPSGSVGKHDVDKILFVQNIHGRETMEVVMKAEDLDSATEDDINKIFYAGVSMSEIFSKNLYNGKKDAAWLNSMATFKSRKVRFPKKGKRIILTVNPKYISDDKNAIVYYLDSNKDKIVGQGMRTYLSNDSYPVIHKSITDIIDNKAIWEDEDITESMAVDSLRHTSNRSFLNIIRKENDEIIMSNLLAYYFNYDHSIFEKFASHVLKLQDFGKTFDIKREFNNIDLWIQSNTSILVIENKIKSGINGKNDNGRTQLDKYYECAEKYKQTHGFKNVYYYLFLPNFNDLQIVNNKAFNKFFVVKYSDIYTFFKKYAAEFLDDKYFPDFLVALKNQTMSYPELRYSIMRNRFLDKIRQR